METPEDKPVCAKSAETEVVSFSVCSVSFIVDVKDLLRAH